jgi:hypothetical protein
VHLEPLVVAVRAHAAVVDRADRAVREDERDDCGVDIADLRRIRVRERRCARRDFEDVRADDVAGEVEVVAGRVEEKAA